MKSLSKQLLATCAIALPIVGCGGGGQDTPPLSPVSGVVTLDGQPLSEVMVMFQPTAGGRASMGKTDTTGSYVLNFNGETQGAILGDHTVSIRTPMETPDPSVKERVPAVYNRKSMLMGTVTDGDNTINFDLKSKPFARR